MHSNFSVLISKKKECLTQCTTSHRKDKAQQDIKKLVNLAQQMRRKYPTKGVKGWFVTQEEPTADQRSVANAHSGLVLAVSYHQFKAQVIDSESYLEHRKLFTFGSMQEKKITQSTNNEESIENFHYINLNILSESGQKWSVHDLASDLLNNKRFVLSGDYGAGKSTTTREIFLDLAKRYWTNRSLKFPILLNLREHHGQIDPSEALARHARQIGFSPPSHLVRAWLGGYAILILDGFDEIATLGWTGQVKKLRDIRFRSMELIRAFIRKTPLDTGIAVSGRSFFFDNDRELKKALEVDRSFTVISLSDFNEHQIKEFLDKRNWKGAIPTWFPSRPLLLGYLASKGLLEHLVTIGNSLSPAAGWHELLTRVCDREAAIEAGIEGISSFPRS